MLFLSPYIYVSLNLEVTVSCYFSLELAPLFPHNLFPADSLCGAEQSTMPPVLGAASPAAGFAEALENSGRIIDRHLQEDRCFPDLSELLSVFSHSEWIVHLLLMGRQ